MNRKLMPWVLIFAIALGGAIFASGFSHVWFLGDRVSGMTIPEMNGDKCRSDGWNGGMMGDRDRMADMRIVRQLFAQHDRIHRSVEDISGGVRTVTESDDPDVAALIQQHVMRMHQRLEDGRWFAMMSSTLPILFRNADRYERSSEITADGIAVTKTSEDRNLAAVLREHADEVTGFVESGMPSCMGDGMM